MSVEHVTRDERGTMERITGALYWFAVIDVLLVLTSAPTVVTWLLLVRDASNLPLYAASLLFVLPAVGASFWAWRAWTEDPDPVPLKRFLRGYRLNVVDSLKIAVPGMVVLTVLATNITYGHVAGTSVLSIAFLIMAVMVALVMMRALSLASALSFRFVDILRLSAFTLLTMPLRTVALLSLGVLAAGISLFIGDYAFLLLGSVLTFTMYRSERPVIARIREQFVAEPEARSISR